MFLFLELDLDYIVTQSNKAKKKRSEKEL